MVVEIFVTQRWKSPVLAALTLVRTIIGFIFKIRYSSKRSPLSVGLADIKPSVMVSAGSRVYIPFGLTTPFRDGVPGRCWTVGIVWKIRACGKRVAGTYRHRFAHKVFQAKNKLKAATNAKPCLAVLPHGVSQAASKGASLGAVQS